MMKTINLDGKALEAVAGHFDEALRLIESRFGVRITARGADVVVGGVGDNGHDREERVADLLQQLSDLHQRGVVLGREDLKTAISALVESANLGESGGNNGRDAVRSAIHDTLSKYGLDPESLQPGRANPGAYGGSGGAAMPGQIGVSDVIGLVGSQEQATGNSVLTSLLELLGLVDEEA